ncbi:MAG: LytTR family transcriptional regulator DNA-binding domain-containing protein [Saprospiraceae bacterium]|nr:LytTR family transcriptional regulator DNA-binding domain-containing protein [Saprospiraceae bacterium]
MTALLVDDMPRAIQVLQADLEALFPEMEILGTAQSVVEAAKFLRHQQPDILFLDILLGDGTGFDLLEIFPDLRSKVIFVTASDEFAIRAFQFAAIDYLLKPIDPPLLKKAVERARAQMAQSNESLDLLKETIRKPDELPSRISLHTQEKIQVVEIETILRCESDGNNTLFLLTTGQKVFVTKTLKQFETLLENHAFLRVHQSHLINIDQIREFVRKDGGYLVMKNGDKIPVSVRKRAEVMKIFS